MTRKRGKKGPGARDVATENFEHGCRSLNQHPMFAPLLTHAHVIREDHNLCPKDGWAVVTSNGQVHVHPTRIAKPDEWIYILAHCLLHLGLGHFQARPKRLHEWNAACDGYLAGFLATLKLGHPPEVLPTQVELPARTEERLYEIFCDRGVPEQLRHLGTAGPEADDMCWEPETVSWWGRKVDWQACFGEGLTMAVTSAVNVAAGREPYLGAKRQDLTPIQKARSWFLNSYPLLGSLATTFEIVEDPLICVQLGISVAAIDAASKKIFVSPAAGLNEHEGRFVMAHELLHVGMRHDSRRQGREPFLWNVACDYVINGWLVEMGLGDLPKVGALYDPALKGESAESIYDRIVTDMRRYRKLATLRGVGLCDILERGRPNWWAVGNGLELDEFYRRCMSQGLLYHEEQGRGLLPAGLVEEIRALSHPPIPWDVELAQWFDHYFPPLEKVRSYARSSRRQSATPDIPRPSWVPAWDAEDGRTFGVVLDTSGSMDKTLLAKALGAIASYSMSRDVRLVRLVFCDAATYDQGYLPPEAIADQVKVKGGGCTILQPGVDLLEKAGDFPEKGPLLIITDGYCDRLRIRREHAFLIPEARHLPFVPRGKVFRIK